MSRTTIPTQRVQIGQKTGTCPRIQYIPGCSINPGDHDSAAFSHTSAWWPLRSTRIEAIHTDKRQNFFEQFGMVFADISQKALPIFKDERIAVAA